MLQGVGCGTIQAALCCCIIVAGLHTEAPLLTDLASCTTRIASQASPFPPRFGSRIEVLCLLFGLASKNTRFVQQKYDSVSHTQEEI